MTEFIGNKCPGRTGGRHSVIVPLDDKGDLLSIGGKNASVNGWSTENFFHQFTARLGAKAFPSPFPHSAAGSVRAMIRLADGNLFFVSDAFLHKLERPPPTNWNYGNGCFVAISTNNGIRGTSRLCRCNCRTISSARMARSATSRRGRRRTASFTF